MFFAEGEHGQGQVVALLWLRTNGVDANAAAAEVMNSDRFGEKGTPWHFWGGKSRLTAEPKKSVCQKA